MGEKIEVGDLVEVREGGNSGAYFVGPNPWTARVEQLYKKDGSEILVRAEPPIPGCRHEKMALSSHDSVRVIAKRRVRRNNEVCGLTAGLFQRVEEELLKAFPSESRAYALRCLTEIHDQFEERHNAAMAAEGHFRAIWEASEAARHKLHEAHVDFGGTWDPNPIGKLTS